MDDRRRADSSASLLGRDPLVDRQLAVTKIHEDGACAKGELIGGEIERYQSIECLMWY